MAKRKINLSYWEKTFEITPQGGLQVIRVQRPCKVISFKIICMKLVIICMVTTQIFSLTVWDTIRSIQMVLRRGVLHTISSGHVETFAASQRLSQENVHNKSG